MQLHTAASPPPSETDNVAASGRHAVHTTPGHTYTPQDCCPEGTGQEDLQAHEAAAVTEYYMLGRQEDHSTPWPSGAQGPAAGVHGSARALATPCQGLLAGGKALSHWRAHTAQTQSHTTDKCAHPCMQAYCRPNANSFGLHPATCAAGITQLAADTAAAIRPTRQVPRRPQLVAAGAGAARTAVGGPTTAVFTPPAQRTS